MTTEMLVGKYHPDPEINEGVAADAREGEQANLAVGFAPSQWECECGSAHDRGHFLAGSVAIQVKLGDGAESPDGIPLASVYLSPVDAALLGAQIIASARVAVPEAPNAH